MNGWCFRLKRAVKESESETISLKGKNRDRPACDLQERIVNTPWLWL